MTIQQLEYILEVNRSGSINQAAQNLYVSQSSVSSAVCSLEKELGEQIFQRKWNGVVPTPRGFEILEYASQICEIHKSMAAGRKPLKRTIRISYPSHPCFGNAYIRLLEEYRNNSDVVFVQASSEQFEQKLALSELNLAIRAILAPYTRTAEHHYKQYGLEGQKLGSLQAVLSISSAHPLFQKPDLCVQDFRNETVISTDRGVSSELMRCSVDIHPDRILMVHDTNTRRELWKRGFGYFISYMTDPNYITQERKLIPIPELRFDFIAVTNPTRPMSQEIRRYLELVEEELGPHHFKQQT